MSEEIKMCDVVEGKPATMTFQWDWGERGVCSPEGQNLLLQKSRNLKRHVAFVPLADAPKAPVGRDERAKLHAARLAAEDECREMSERCSRAVTRQNELAAELKSERAKSAELSAQVADAKSELATAREQRDRYAKQVHDLTTQVDKQNVLLESDNDAIEQLKVVQEEYAQASKELATLHEQLAGEKERANELAKQRAALRQG